MLALCLILGTPPRGFCRLGPSLPPAAWVGPQGSSSPVGPAQTGQRARPRTASDVLAHTPGDVGGRAIWLWVPQSALQEGPPGGGPGTLAGPSLLQAGVTPPQVWDGERTGPPGAMGGGCTWHVPQPALCLPLRGEGLWGACLVSCPLPMPGSRWPAPGASRRCGKARMLPARGFLALLCCPSISPKLKAWSPGFPP